MMRNMLSQLSVSFIGPIFPYSTPLDIILLCHRIRRFKTGLLHNLVYMLLFNWLIAGYQKRKLSLHDLTNFSIKSTSQWALNTSDINCYLGTNNQIQKLNF